MLRALCLVLALSACGKDQGVLALDVGRESDALTASPAPSQWELGFTPTEGERGVLATGAWPSKGLDVKLDPDSVGRFDVAFTDGAGTSLAVGDAPLIALGDLPGHTLTMFVQRRGAFARPTPDLDPRERPVAAVIGGRILAVGGGSDQLAAFDLALVGALGAQAFGATPDALGATRSALFGTVGGRLVRLDLSTGATSDVALPSNVAAAELTGAPLVARAGGFAWVGAVRTDPSPAIVFVAADETMQSTRLPTAVAPCVAAPFSDGALLVACSDAVHHVGADGAVAAQPFPALTPDAVGILDDGTLLLASGGHAYRALGEAAQDLGQTACASRPQIVALGTEALLACDAADGTTRAYRLTDGLAEVPLREARRGATLVALGAREAALVGGGAASFERYRPLTTP